MFKKSDLLANSLRIEVFPVPDDPPSSIGLLDFSCILSRKNYLVDSTVPINRFLVSVPSPG